MPMLDPEATIVPLETADDVLSAFGIAADDAAYQRWRQENGFRLIDLEGVLGQSPFVLRVDWREWLQDAVATMIDQLGALGMSAISDWDEQGQSGYIEIDGKREAVKYVPNDDDNFDRVIRKVNSLIPTKGQYRRLRSSEGSDGWCYGLLSNDVWKRLEASASDLTNDLFAELHPTKLEVIEGDLLDQDVDVIVNAWNRNIIPWWLLLPQGISRAIKRGAGTQPFKELAKHGPMPLGSAVLTSAARLPFKRIIHVAGINMLWRASERSIRSSVRNAMRLAREKGFTSIALPLIGAGSGGFDTNRAMALILDELESIDSPIAVKVVVFKKA